MPPPEIRPARPRRTPSRFGRRGEVYVLVQFVLILLVVAGPAQVAGWPAWQVPPSLAVNLAAISLVAIGVVLLVTGTRRLGTNLTPWPQPKSDGRLVQEGLYARVRHPLYGGLMLVAVGWSLRRGGGLALAYAGLLVWLLAMKARVEEQWLTARHPEYVSYRTRTWRFVPWIW